jgi:hypothetical protein
MQHRTHTIILRQGRAHATEHTRTFHTGVTHTVDDYTGPTYSTQLPHIALIARLRWCERECELMSEEFDDATKSRMQLV